eukprot:TRINITY_DN400_c0_g2_i1.p1 TRINITY_DN400_c0_g2~~TRINITY_DN400_c0_g2_i1.p1  ORF type:complete len:299 (-),score=48.93 TRINITY_DN400_c0_g2_i1:85-888(-)
MCIRDRYQRRVHGEGNQICFLQKNFLHLKRAYPEYQQRDISLSLSLSLSLTMNGKFVIAAEDDAFCQTTLKVILKSLGVDFAIVGNGSEAVKLWSDRGGDVSVILMDIHMPVMDGYEATAAIRKLQGSIGGSTKILGLTADDDPKTATAASACGMDTLLKKPLKKDILAKWLQAEETQRFENQENEWHICIMEGGMLRRYSGYWCVVFNIIIFSLSVCSESVFMREFVDFISFFFTYIWGMFVLRYGEMNHVYHEEEATLRLMRATQ